MEQEKVTTNQSDMVLNQDSIQRAHLDSLINANFQKLGLIDVTDVDPRFLVEVKYAGTENFMGVRLYDSLNSIYLQQEVVERLKKVQDVLDSLRPGYRLLIYDGVRPLQVQQEMWDAMDSIPVVQRGKFVSNPVWGSVHNFGAAVDLTIADELGKPLDMGAGYDDFRDIAYPAKEAEFLKSGELTKLQYENRRLLRKVMRTQNFTNIPTEWWHFNAYSRITASKKFKQLLDESGKSRTFEVAPMDTTSVDSLQLNGDLIPIISPL